MAQAKIRKDILKEDLSIPAKVKDTGVKVNIQFKNVVDSKEYKGKDDFYNTEIILAGVSYLVNSIDLEFV